MAQQQEQQQHHKSSKHRRRRHSSLQASIGGWFDGLSRRLSLSGGGSSAHATSDSNPGPSAPAAAAAAASDDEAGASGIQQQQQASPRPLSHRERHQINLRYHLLRDHKDALRLCGGALTLMEELERAAAMEAGDEVEQCWLRWLCNSEEGGSDWDDLESGSWYDDEEDCSSSCSSDSCLVKMKHCGRLKDCDSDSCLSTCSGCSKRFKHQRRSDRWNQEYDEEFKERNGLIDCSYSRVNQIK